MEPHCHGQRPVLPAIHNRQFLGAHPRIPLIEQDLLPSSHGIMAEFPTVFDWTTQDYGWRRIPHWTRRQRSALLCPHTSRDTICQPWEAKEWAGPPTKAGHHWTSYHPHRVVCPHRRYTQKKTRTESDCALTSLALISVSREKCTNLQTPGQAVADIAYRERKESSQSWTPSRNTISCPLAEASQLLTTCTKTFGRFKFFRAPYGIILHFQTLP